VRNRRSGRSDRRQSVPTPGWRAYAPAQVAATGEAVRTATLASGHVAAVSGRRAAGRIDAIDLARGMAVALMILSHGVNGLLAFEQFTDWGMVPVHAMTKFASSLFITVFGIALAVAFVPHVDTPQWPAKRLKLLLNGLIVLFWYKLLTIVEMNHLYAPADIVDALLYRTFPSYVEILGFYAIALLWLPWVLPLWPRLPAWARWSSPLVAIALTLTLQQFDFWGVAQLQALVVEHPDFYTWGQLSRLPLVLLGLLLGGLILQARDDDARRWRLAAGVGAAGLALLAVFAVLAAPAIGEALLAIARNAGKHPPELQFMLYSLGGALCLLAIAVAGGRRLAAVLRPLTVIGSNALQAFVFHIVVIFVLFRLLFGWFHTVDYGFALTMSLLLIGATAAWIGLLRWIQRRA